VILNDCDYAWQDEQPQQTVYHPSRQTQFPQTPGMNSIHTGANEKKLIDEQGHFVGSTKDLNAWFKKGPSVNTVRVNDNDGKQKVQRQAQKSNNMQCKAKLNSSEAAGQETEEKKETTAAAEAQPSECQQRTAEREQKAKQSVEAGSVPEFRLSHRVCLLLTLLFLCLTLGQQVRAVKAIPAMERKNVSHAQHVKGLMYCPTTTEPVIIKLPSTATCAELGTNPKQPIPVEIRVFSPNKGVRQVFLQACILDQVKLKYDKVAGRWLAKDLKDLR
jgi:hypothetical protein